MFRSAVRAALALLLLAPSVSVFAQVPQVPDTPVPVEGASDHTPVIDGPPAPVPPATINRDDEGDATVRASST